MTGLTGTVQCPLPGLEMVAITYNLLASEKDLKAALEDMTAGNVVVEMSGWPEDGPFGKEPFGEGVPVAFRAWFLKGGFYRAIGEFANDPNFLTGSKRSTRRTPTEG